MNITLDFDHKFSILGNGISVEEKLVVRVYFWPVTVIRSALATESNLGMCLVSLLSPTPSVQALHQLLQVHYRGRKASVNRDTIPASSAYTTIHTSLITHADASSIFPRRDARCRPGCPRLNEPTVELPPPPPRITPRISVATRVCSPCSTLFHSKYSSSSKRTRVGMPSWR